MLKCVIVFVFVTGISAQFKCPQRTGFFPDPEECDLYYLCSQGEYEEKLCPDGLVFDDKDPNHERCDIPANVDCGDRTVLQEPKPSKGCPRANGYYRHPDANACDKFYNCVDGEPNELACPPGLIYDDIDSTCAWPSDSKRKDCFKSKKDSLDDGFQCPDGDTEGPNGSKLPHPTFAHPDDCQKFYICRNAVMPQKGSCSAGKVYNEETFTCDDPANVPGCEDYYEKKKKN
ncbi:protein obstructor-E-like [Anoplophora glabripennis]|uniref:protein obstructor-E-like n=1 Tax=Anoplophora glabripennis TaxID=217634 RepID=UPI0008740FDB|nr:protein obstructor-E-like [Anoplophora glabripennis]